jgi:hypothetical protein
LCSAAKARAGDPKINPAERVARRFIAVSFHDR